MEASLQPIGSDYLSSMWEKGIETKLDTIANGREYFWREKLISLYRNSSRKISLNMPYESVKKEIIEMLRNKQTFQAVIKKLAYTVKISSDLYDFEGNTLLHHAAAVEKIEALDFLKSILVDHEQNLLKKNREGMIPFQKALCHGENPITRENVVPFLMEKHLEKSYDLGKIVDRYGRNCLHLMAIHFHDPKQEKCSKSVHVITNFLKYYQDVIKLDAQDSMGLTAFDYSIINKNYNITQLLLNAGANPSAGICSPKLNIDDVMAVYECKKIEEKKRLDFFKLYEEEECKLDNKMLSDMKSKWHPTLELITAIKLFRQSFNSIPREFTGVREFLLKELIKVVNHTSKGEINTQDEQGDTLLHIAVLSESREIIEMIVEKGGDVNKRNKKQLTPVGLSIIKGKARSLETIMKTIETMESSEIAKSWPGIEMPTLNSLSFYALSTCKSACLFEIVLKMENINSEMLYEDASTKTPKTLSYRDWAFKLHHSIAIFVFIKQAGYCTLPIPEI